MSQEIEMKPLINSSNAMVTRANALRAVMGMFLTIVELIISLDFFKNISSERIFEQINRLFFKLSIIDLGGSGNLVDSKQILL